MNVEVNCFPSPIVETAGFDGTTTSTPGGRESRTGLLRLLRRLSTMSKNRVSHQISTMLDYLVGLVNKSQKFINSRQILMNAIVLERTFEGLYSSELGKERHKIAKSHYHLANNSKGILWIPCLLLRNTACG